MANSCCFLWKASISSCILWLLYQSSHRKMLLIYAWKHLQFYTNAIRIKDFLCFFIASMVRFFLHLMSFLYLAGLKEVRIFYIQVLHLWVLAGYNWQASQVRTRIVYHLYLQVIYHSRLWWWFWVRFRNSIFLFLMGFQPDWKF